MLDICKALGAEKCFYHKCTYFFIKGDSIILVIHLYGKITKDFFHGCITGALKGDRAIDCQIEFKNYEEFKSAILELNLSLESFNNTKFFIYENTQTEIL